MSQLQCFNSWLYASPAQCGHLPRQCIAPTMKKLRCSWKINDNDYDEAVMVGETIATLPHGPERNNALAEFILLHCCTKQHRHKLEADESGCLDQLIESYGALMPALQCASQSPEPETSSSHEGGMELRSRTILFEANTESSRSRRKPNYFVRYKSDPTDSIRQDLLDDVPQKWAAKGEVYCFEWPEYPKFIKIGYTARSAQDRVAQWRECNPGSILKHSIVVDFPERIERLVHLEMAQHRYRIGICRNRYCGRSHEEWFETTSDQATKIIDAWAEVAHKEALYSQNRMLTDKWRKRIQKMDGIITAQGLLDLLQAEYMKELEEPTVLKTVSLPMPSQDVLPLDSGEFITNENESGTVVDLEDSYLIYFSDIIWQFIELDRSVATSFELETMPQPVALVA